MSETSTALAVHQSTRLPTLPSGDEHRLMLQMSGVLFKSGMLPSHIRSEQAAFAVIQKGYELGVPPMYALTNIVVIQGKPTAGAEMMLALIFRDHGDDAIRYVESTAEVCTINYRRRGWRTPSTYSYTIEEARFAGLVNDRSPGWSKFPTAMLRARCVSAVARMAFADTIGGLYTPEEMGVDVAVDDEGSITVVSVPTSAADETHAYDRSTGERRTEPTPFRAASGGGHEQARRAAGVAAMATAEPAPKPAAPTGDAAASPAQVRAIYTIARTKHGIGETEMAEACEAQYGRRPDALTKREASELVSAMQSVDWQPPTATPAPAPPADNLDALHRTAAEGDFLEVDDDPFESA